MIDSRVQLDPPYWIRLRPTFRETWGALREDHGDRPWLIVGDRQLLATHPRALAGLTRRERDRVVAVRGGESAKSVRGIERLFRAALAAGLDRSHLVVGLGGGTVGDVVGFFAASYLRGVDWCPFATTTLSLADSAVGGKTGVNFGGLKNLVGAFHQPVGVYGAMEAIQTLPRRHRVAGVAEIVKSAMIADRRLFARLERRGVELADPASPLWLEVLVRCTTIKAEIVARDPRESGPRALLNFGHTVGHALEAVLKPRPLHGEAVALGMIAATLISEWLEMASEGTFLRLEALLDGLGLPTKISGLDPVRLSKALRYDKKNRGGQARMVLTQGVGSATFGHAVTAATLRRAARCLQARKTRSPRP